MNTTIEELVKIGQHQVRNNPNLMTAYITLFKEKFGYEPNCAGCTFNTDWQKFINAVGGQYSAVGENTKTMDKTFKLYDELEIYTYKEKLENGVEIPVRTYGYKMTEEFAKKYLSIGTEEQITERQKEFKILPQEETQTEEDKRVDLSKLNFKQLQAFAKEKAYPNEDWENLKKKEDLIAYIETQLLTEEETQTEE